MLAEGADASSVDEERTQPARPAAASPAETSRANGPPASDSPASAPPASESPASESPASESSASESAAAIQVIIERYLNEIDLTAFSEDARLTVPTAAEPLEGRQAIANWFRNFQIGFPDAALQPTQITCTEQMAAAEFNFTGVNTAPYLGIEPNYNHVLLPMAGFFEVQDGEIVRARIYYDPGELARQIVAGYV